MSDSETTTTDTDSTTERPTADAAGVPNFDEMCRGFTDMGSRMMAQGMPECCRPGSGTPMDFGRDADET